MINTVFIKKNQLRHGFLTLGSGKEVVLIMGSCRVVNYVTYLNDWNEANGNRFTIHTLDPFNWWWNENDDRVDCEAVINGFEKDETMLSMLRSVDIFIHEYYQNFGIFNCSKESTKNIYQFGMSPKIDVCVPSFNDLFILFGDIVTFDSEMRKKAAQDFNALGKLSAKTKNEILEVSQQNIAKFYKVCRLSDIPEMESFFMLNFKSCRLFWSYNHVSKWFTLAVFKIMNSKFLKLDLSKGFNEGHEDIFANNYTYLTHEDIEAYGYNWGEEIKPLRDRL